MTDFQNGALTVHTTDGRYAVTFTKNGPSFVNQEAPKPKRPPRKSRPCGRCHGGGEIRHSDGESWELCPHCGGSGLLPVSKGWL